MAVEERIFTKKALSMAIAQIKSPALFLWDMLIGTEKLEKTVKFEIQTKEAGRYRVPLVGRRENGILIEKDGFETSVYEPPMMKFHVVNKAEELFEQKFGQTAYDNGTNFAQQELAEELTYLKNIAARTKLWMVSELVTKGVCPLEDGKIGIKFGDFQKEILTDTDIWSEENTDIIAYLQKKQLEIQKKTGKVIDTLIISPDVEAALLKNNHIKEYLKQTNANIIRVNDSSARKSSGEREVMYLPTLNIMIYSYIDWVADITNKNAPEVPVLPEKTVIGFKKGDFVCHYGPLALRPAPKQRATLHIMKEVVRPNYPEGTEDDVLEYFSAPLVAPKDAAGWFCAQVLK